MDKKIIVYVSVGILLLTLILSSFNVMDLGLKGKSIKNNTESYANLPEECRKPEGQSIEAWKEHLSHHENTKYCLDYFKNP